MDMDIPSGVQTRASKSRGPRAMACYICGRQFGLNSYSIHTKQCRKLFEARESKKPPRERKAIPQEPTSLLNLLREGGVDSGGLAAISNRQLDELNEAANTSFNENGLAACQNCGRTFLEDKLEIHQRSCRATSPARRVNAPLTKREGGASGAFFKGGSIRRSIDSSPGQEVRVSASRPKTANVASSSGRPGLPPRSHSATKRDDSFIHFRQDTKEENGIRLARDARDHDSGIDGTETLEHSADEKGASMAGSIGKSSNMNAMRKHSKNAAATSEGDSSIAQSDLRSSGRISKKTERGVIGEGGNTEVEREKRRLDLLLKKVENIELILGGLTMAVTEIKGEISSHLGIGTNTSFR